MKKLFLFVPLFLLTASSNLNDVNVDKTIYKVYYSQRFEQPLELTYESTNRPTNVNRGSMDFYGEPGVKTSDNADYANNIYDKGHLAPAATFSDNMVNLKLTFSYLNSALQNQYLNRGEWRLLEEQERKWDDVENLTVKISVDFKGASLITVGGKAPGPEPLKIALIHMQAILDRKNDGEKLTTLECHDIICHLADAVLSGGIRRAALIALFNLHDEDMLTCKFGPWWENNPQRGRANNSAVLLRNMIDKETFMGLWSKIEASNSGEPGFLFTEFVILLFFIE